MRSSYRRLDPRRGGAPRSLQLIASRLSKLVGDAALLRELVEAGRAHAGFPAVQEYQALYVLAHAVREDPPTLAPAAVFDHGPYWASADQVHNL
jgi:hypothetical protein